MISSKTIIQVLAASLIIMIILFSLDKCKSISHINDTFKPEVIDVKFNKDSMRTHYERYTDSLVSIISVSNNVPLVETKYVYIDREINPSNELDTNTRVFVYQRKDSLLDYSISVYGNERPSKVQIDYDIKQLTIRDSIFVRDSIYEKETQKVRVNQVYLGPELIVYPGFKGGFVSLDFISKKGLQLEAGGGYAQFDNGAYLVGKVGIKKLITFRKRHAKRN